MDELAEKHADRFRVWYTVDRSPSDWRFSTGYINEKMISEHLPVPGENTAILLCGPPPMITFAASPSLDKVAHAPDNRFVF